MAVRSLQQLVLFDVKQFQKLTFQPGINREGTKYAAEGRWWDCDRIRFRMGLPETIGGWARYVSTPFIGICRALLSWQTLAGSDMLAVGTSKKLYIENGDALYDITPIVATFTENAPITTGLIGDTIVTMATSTAHGASPSDFVIVSGAVDVGGIPAAALNREFTILSTPAADEITVDTGVACTSNYITGGGAAVKLEFELGIGAESSSVGAGWGVGPYSRGAYGSDWSIPYSSYDALRLWTFDNYGEDLVACAFGKEIFYWDATNGLSTRAVPLSTMGGSGAPAEVGYVMVTNERHMVAFGCTDLFSGKYDPMLIRWASQEEPTQWTPSVSNTSGDYRLATGDHIEGFSATRDEILVITDMAIYSMRYSGAPFVFDVRQIADNISAASPNSVVTLNNVTYWMGHYKFYMYNGTSQSIPCTVHRHVFNDFNHAQARQVCAGHVEQFSEVWWFYPSKNSNVLDKYVIYNYTDNIWYIGNLGRTAWVKAASTHELISASSDGYLYVQEFGTEDGSVNPPVPLNAFIETGDFDIEDGTQFYFVERIIPDMRFDRSNSIASTPEVHITLQARDFPGQTWQQTDTRTVSRTATVPVDQFTNEAWVRIRGRQLSMRIEADPDDKYTAWQIGYPRISVRTDGRR